MHVPQPSCTLCYLENLLCLFLLLFNCTHKIECFEYLVNFAVKYWHWTPTPPTPSILCWLQPRFTQASPPPQLSYDCIFLLLDKKGGLKDEDNVYMCKGSVHPCALNNNELLCVCSSLIGLCPVSKASAMREKNSLCVKGLQLHHLGTAVIHTVSICDLWYVRLSLVGLFPGKNQFRH